MRIPDAQTTSEGPAARAEDLAIATKWVIHTLAPDLFTRENVKPQDLTWLAKRLIKEAKSGSEFAGAARTVLYRMYTGDLLPSFLTAPYNELMGPAGVKRRTKSPEERPAQRRRRENNLNQRRSESRSRLNGGGGKKKEKTQAG